MKRRNFIQKTAAATAFIGGGGLTLEACQQTTRKQITILHTNDVHSHIDPFPNDHYKTPGKGGIARRASLVEAVRKENPHTLLLDAGDIFQGTPYFNQYGGALEFKLMSMLSYDAATLGNHDFDNGTTGLFTQLPHATFDFLCANYGFENTVLDGHIKPYRIFVKNGIRIGVFGLGIALAGLVDPALYKETTYLDPVEIGEDTARILREEQRCDLVICLSHLGYQYQNEPNKVSDLTLAAKTANIDLIIGGHTHTFLPKPTLAKNRLGQGVLVNQVGCYGINMGRIDFYFDKDQALVARGESILV